jgi:enoyl-CoA hydratase/carnithine racemase
MHMNFEQVELEVVDGIATLSLNRPDKRNAMSDQMRSEFIEAMEYIAIETSIRALVLTGKGKGFCAGGDISGMEKRLSAPVGELAINGWRRQLRVHHAVALLFELPKPTIAAVNGPASGLGADTALACDFIMACDEANFTWSYIHRGIIPDGGGMYFLPRRVGLVRAKELIFSGRKVECKEAAELGIVDRVSTLDGLVADAVQWAKDLSQGSAAALALSKTILNQSFETTAHNIFASGAQAQGICYTTTEHRHAVEAFLQKAAQAKKN